jgi:NAD(P)-dependent dehydrogenase (short-subunit alcohol dehydrogenase family)
MKELMRRSDGPAIRDMALWLGLLAGCASSAGWTAWSNAAGLGDRDSLLDTTPELFDAHIAVNPRGPFILMQAVVAHVFGGLG